jgi:hypothetical protein
MVNIRIRGDGENYSQQPYGKGTSKATIIEEDGRLCVASYDAYIDREILTDLQDVIDWVKENKPEMLESK